MGSGSYETRSYAHMLSMVKEELKLENTNQHDGYLVRQIDLITRNIGDLGCQVADHCIVPIIDGKAHLPKHLTKVLGFKYHGNGADCYPGVFLDRRFLGTCGCTLIGNDITSTASIEGEYLVFHDPLNLQTNEVNITFMKRRVDANGNALVTAQAELSVITGVAKAWYRREKDFGAYREYSVAHAAAAGNTRAVFARLDFEENRAEVAAWMNNWLKNDNLLNLL